MSQDQTIKTVTNGELWPEKEVSEVKPPRPGGKFDPFRAYRISKQTMIIAAWISIGLYAGVIGPTLPDLRDSLGVGTDDISLVLVGKSFGFVTGALIGGFVFRIFYKQAELLMFLSIAGMATIALAPWGNSLWYVVFFFWTAGTSEGILNVGGNTMVMHLWQEYAATPLLLTHFGFGLGSVIAPQLARPFISSGSDDDSNATTCYSSKSKGWQDKRILVDIYKTEEYTDIESNFEYCYVVVAAIILLIACAYLYFVITDPPKGFETWTPEGDTKAMLNPGSCANGHWVYSLELLVCLFLYYMHLGGGQSSFSDYLFTFATESDLCFSDEEASLLNSAFWLAYALGRLGGALVAHWVIVQIMIPTSICVSAACMITMAIYAEENALLFWILTCTFGLFLAVLFPAGMGWGNLYLNMNSMSTMILLMGSGLGKIPYQYLAGYVFEEYGEDYIMFVSSACFIVLICVFVVMQIIGSCQRSNVLYGDEEQVVIDAKSLSERPYFSSVNVEQTYL